MEFTIGRHAAVAGSDEHTTTTGITSDEIETASEKNIIIHTTERLLTRSNRLFYAI
ncbi:hypothetical protein Hanom_Chr04g00287221 [Helianthus anomalus]